MNRFTNCRSNCDQVASRVDITGLINRYYPPATLAHEVLVRHSEAVAEAALRIAGKVAHLKPNLGFIEEAALLHDIGIFHTRSPAIGCHGTYPYLSHGYLGRHLLEGHGLMEHARVCESHVGVGLTARDIETAQLPLPVRDMVPESIEEQIICFADLFFSKTPPPSGTRHTAVSVAASLEQYGSDKVERFADWLEQFGEPAAEENFPKPVA